MAEEVHTTVKLAVRLEHIQRCVSQPDERALFDDLIRHAREGYYHDYLSPIIMPDVQLVCDLRAVAEKISPHVGNVRGMILNLVSEVIDGKFEASLQEGEEWMLSPQGQAALDALPGRVKELMESREVNDGD